MCGRVGGCCLAAVRRNRISISLPDSKYAKVSSTRSGWRQFHRWRVSGACARSGRAGPNSALDAWRDIFWNRRSQLPPYKTGGVYRGCILHSSVGQAKRRRTASERRAIQRAGSLKLYLPLTSRLAHGKRVSFCIAIKNGNVGAGAPLQPTQRRQNKLTLQWGAENSSSEP